MANTYVKIASVSVGLLGAASMDFTSIPSTYTDLLLDISARSNISAYRSTMAIQANGDTASNYNYKRLFASGSTVGSDADPGSTTYFVAGEVVGALSTASTFTNTCFYLPNYTASTQKSGSSDAALETNDSTNNRLSMVASKWSGTAAVTSLKIFDSTGSNNFVQYSTATLYGISKS
jgi:hypothetical protein